MQKRRSLLFWPLLASLATSVNTSMNCAADVGVALGIEGGYADINWNEFEDSTSVSVHAAWRIIDWFGFEAGFSQLNDFDVEDGNSSINEVEMKYAGLHFHGAAGLFGMNASALLGAYESDMDRYCPNCVGDSDSSDSGVTYGVRFGVPVVDFLDITLGWQNFYRVEGDTHFNLYQAGVEFHF